MASNEKDEEALRRIINYTTRGIGKTSIDRITMRAKEQHKTRFVASSIGQNNKTGSMSPEVNDPGYRVVTVEELRID